jgi:hypothetical protein
MNMHDADTFCQTRDIFRDFPPPLLKLFSLSISRQMTKLSFPHHPSRATERKFKQFKLITASCVNLFIKMQLIKFGLVISG